MSSEDAPDNNDISDVLAHHIASLDDVFGGGTEPTEPQDETPCPPEASLPGAAPEDEVFTVPERPSPRDNTPPAELPDVNTLTIPHDDGFLEEERRLYTRALAVYDHILDTGTEKTRLQAAKDIVSIYTGRRDTAVKAAMSTKDAGTTNNHLHITVDSVKTALQSALHGMEGGMATTTKEFTYAEDDDGDDK